MTLYANFVANPSFELATTGWTAEKTGASLTRSTTSPTAGTQVLNVSYSSGDTSDRGGAQITVTVEPGQTYTVSMAIKNISESHAASNNAGVVVTVYDLLPGQAASTRQLVKTATFARTTSGRVAVRACTPRATADRLVITVTSSSSYYKAPVTHTDSSGRVWITTGTTSSGGITSPSGIHISQSEWDDYAQDGYTLGSSGTFVYRDNLSSISFNARYGTWTKTTQTAPAVYGGTATFQIDAVQVEQGATETTYVDGTVAGYAWSGTAHNSPTLNLASAEAHASGLSTGTLIFGLVFQIKSGATAASTGTLATVVTSVGSHAAATSTGTIALWNYGPASASGTSLSAGEIVMAAIVDLELHGTATSTGTTKAGIAILTFAGATATGTGTIEIGQPPDAEAHGTAESVGGILQMAIAGVMEAHGTIVSLGTIEILEDIPAGAFSDFSIFGVTESDPRMSVTANSNGGTSTGATGSEWVRIYAEFAAPDKVTTSQGTLWERAAFGVPGILFSNLPAGSWQEFTRVQMELANPTALPTTYMDGASIRALIYPDRLNLAPSTITIVDTAGPTYSTAAETTSPIDDDDAPALLVELEPDTDYSVVADLTRLKPLAAYTVSMLIRLSDGMTNAGFHLRDPDDPDQLADTVAYGDSDEIVSGGWRRISTTFICPVRGVASIVFDWSMTDPQTDTESFEVAAILVEEGAAARDYFFNTGIDPEMRYHQGSTDPSGGVFNYADYERKTYIANQALLDNVPEGIGVNELEFSLIPHYDA